METSTAVRVTCVPFLSTAVENPCGQISKLSATAAVRYVRATHILLYITAALGGARVRFLLRDSEAAGTAGRRVGGRDGHHPGSERLKVKTIHPNVESVLRRVAEITPTLI